MYKMDNLLVDVEELSPEVANVVKELVAAGYTVTEVKEGGDNYDPLVTLECDKSVLISQDGYYSLTEGEGDEIEYLAESLDFDDILDELNGF